MKKRFALTLVVNLIKALLGFVVGVFIARGLGVEEFGDYSFLLATFVSVCTVVELGTSNAFFTFISQRRRGKKFYRFYFSWVLIQAALVISFLYFILPFSLFEKLFVGQESSVVILAYLACFFQQQIWNIIAQVCESERKTFLSQSISLAIAVVNFIGIITLNYFGLMNIPVIFLFTISQFSIALFLFSTFLIDVKYGEDDANYFDVTKEFYFYCLPLTFYILIGFFYRFLDTWLLQHFGGSAEQAYFSIGNKIAAISLIFTTSLLRILWKEIAEADKSGNDTRVEMLFLYSTKTLYLVGFTITGLFFPWAHELILLLLGEGFQGAVFPFAIMLLYPVHQSLGQIMGTMFYATENTKLYSITGVVSMLLSLIASVIVLSDGFGGLPGFKMGAIGLAGKMVLMQIISVNLGMFILAKARGWKFDWLYQLYTPALVCVLAFLSYKTVSWFGVDSFFVEFLTYALLYTISIGLMVLYLGKPILGFELKDYLRKFKVGGSNG
ncbi:lipopolysaccharide biosynthesis protein [Vibrio hepatarius]|uniref:lipopolysaccharide biosynthesis protein n=1 Tax=Vibrio hepatarius TaxID=171383 RepID=UPI00148B3519|nr:lipopolysaccharide biosynthesis protein [Vibrio hepatarius]NOI15136.1 lipopolysaccharide biosynthesis protein [Vibrio hepatarius]